MARKGSIMGLARLEQKLRKLPAAALEEIRSAMAEQAEEVVAMMKRLVPVAEGGGALRDSIGWTWGAAPKGSLAIAAVKGQGLGGGLTITIYAGNKDAYYARWVEFGTQNAAAHPYFFVSWRASRRGARRKTRTAVRKAARKVAGGAT